MSELVGFAVAGLSFGLGFSILAQAQNTWGVVAGLLIMGIGAVIIIQ